MKTITTNRKFSTYALALALSVGTVGGMAGFAGLASPVLAQAAGNGGNNGGGASAGGESSAVMKAANIENPNKLAGAEDQRCEGAADGASTKSCRHKARPTPRIVSIQGFANCAVVQQMRGVEGRPGEFYCLKPM